MNLDQEAKAPHWIVAEVDTLFKATHEHSHKLTPDQLIKVSAGEKFFVNSFTEAPGDHWKVHLYDPKFGLKPWHIYDPVSGGHWLKSWAEDNKEQEPSPPPMVVSLKPKDSPVGAGLKPDMPFDTRITPNFTYGEFAKYEHRRRFTHDYQCETAYELAMFLEKCRTNFDNLPIRITSGHRPWLVNLECGGARNSEHLFSAPLIGAIDFYVKGVSVYDVQDYCDREWGGSVGYGAKRGFVHLGLRGKKNWYIRWPY